MLQFIVFCILLVTCLGQLTPSENFDHNAVLDPNGNVRIWWTFDATHITFEMQANTTGWVGIGISPGGGMANSDIYAGWVANGVTNITDRHGPSSGNSFPPIDAEQNVENLGGLEQDGWTRIKFRRTIAACDSEDITITEGTIRVIYAFGANEDTDITYHGTTDRGTKSLFLLVHGNTGSPYPEGETEHSYFDVTTDNFNLPPVTTYYNCRIFKVPENITTKQHIVTIAPIIQAGNEANVHHILLYACYDVDESTINVGVDSRCNFIPTQRTNCLAILAAWAIGGTNLNFPYNAGYPIGDVDSPKYLQIETHYDNPTASASIVDSSGLRLTYTPQLRVNDAGMMTIGQVVSPLIQFIPPKAESFESFGECSSGCLQKGLSEGNSSSINFFATMLHTHLIGKEMKLQHIRNGVELEPLAVDLNYDFNYQETRWLPKEREVRSGDTLRLICTYNSMARNKMTFGGFSTSDEMCLSFSYYYPRIPLTSCTSRPTSPYLVWRDYFGILNAPLPASLGLSATLYDTDVTLPPNLAGKSVAQVMNEVAWNETKADEFSVFLRQQQATQRCIIGTNRVVLFNLTRVTQDYVTPTTSCTNDVTSAPVTTATISTTSDANGVKNLIFFTLAGAVSATFCRLVDW